jgi:(2Fe-2S) ferredoxin/predicted nucleic acid-binding Zn ribbon protein
MPKPDKHVFVCTQSRPMGHPRGSCAEKGCNEVMQEFLMQLEKRGVFDKIQITATGCMGPCTDGPTVLVYPEGIMYGKVTKDDVNTIFEDHLLGDKPVENLFMPKELWG